ncbi:retrovirus-related pol polyprotein from transposon TNT 1-94 [Tanacetum coccineum]
MSIEEKSRRLAELIRERKKFFVAQRAEAIRNKPPTKTQRRNQKIQYLKNMAGYSYAQLKDNRFDEVQKLFKKHMKWINSFVPMEEDLPSEKVQKEESSEKKAEGSNKKKSIGRKRAKDKQEQESSKRQRVEDDKEEEELKKCFELAKEEEIAINAIPLATKVPVIGFQIHTRGKPGYYEIFRADGTSKLYRVFNQLLKSEVWRSLQGYKDEFAKIMHDEFEMSMMGELNFFLGLQIKQIEDGIFFNQSKYIKEMLKKFGLEESKPMKTPMSFDTKLTKDEECESVDNTKYRGMIEAPNYYLEAVKRIFRYIKGTTHLGLWYPKGTDIETIVYADSDHAEDYVD